MMDDLRYFSLAYPVRVLMSTCVVKGSVWVENRSSNGGVGLLDGDGEPELTLEALDVAAR